MPLPLLAAVVAGGGSPAAAFVDGEDWANSLIHRVSAEHGAVRPRPGPRDAGALGRSLRLERVPRRERQASFGHRGDRRLGGRPARAEAGAWRARAPERHASLGPTVMPRAAPREAGHRHGGRRLGTMLASLGRDILQWVPHAPPPVTGAPIRWVAAADCLAGGLRSVLVELATTFGPLVVNSTCRSRAHNAKVGGAKRSFHLTGNAVDFRVPGNPRPVLAFLRARKDVGGLKHYGGGVFHVDSGPRRTW